MCELVTIIDADVDDSSISGETGDTMVYILHGSELHPVQLAWDPSVSMKDLLLSSSSGSHTRTLPTLPLIITLLASTFYLLLTIPITTQQLLAASSSPISLYHHDDDTT
jgi:hypothetical protein